jgi:hypothetical protein
MSERTPSPSDTLRPVLAAFRWPSNGHLIADVARLGYLNGDVLDPTYGEGKWWTIWLPSAPGSLVRHDLHKLDGVDFRSLPGPAGSFDAVAFDPPYVSPGGRDTSTISSMNDAYGMHSTPRTPHENQRMIEDGMDDITRVLRPGGYLLIKCMDYISSGKFFDATFRTHLHAAALDLIPVDRFEHIGDPRPQPGGRSQVHARRNLSTLLVFQKPRRSRPADPTADPTP